ncbi:MAG: amidohydrolase [bacterium]
MKSSNQRILFIMLSGIYFITSNILAQNNVALTNKLYDEIQSRLNQDYAHLELLYKHLHANPELSFHEEKTAARIAQELKNLDFEVTSNVGGHGFVGVMKNGKGPTVLIRTDLDALPVEENTGLKYASKIRTKDDQGNEVGVMHACGHDVHMTVFVGTARLLSQLKNQWHGALVMIGQPAEETGAGAKAMLEDGLFTKFPRPDYCLALHSNASLPAGKVGICEGYALANVDFVDLKIFGVGGHGAYPHTTKDPIVIAAQIVLALQTIVSREIKPVEPAVVTVGSIHGGTKHNIIPEEVDLQLTLRSYSDQVRNQTIEAIKRISKGIALAAGISEDRLPTLKVREGFIPATYNDPELTRRIAKAMRNLLGDENVLKVEPVMGGEDFGRFGRVNPKIPISIFWLGTVEPKLVAESLQKGTPLPSLHSSIFAPVPTPTLKTGVKAMSAAVLDLLQTE